MLLAWSGDDKGLTMVVVSRVDSALWGVPSFLLVSTPDWARALPAFGIAIVVAAVGLDLLLAGRRQRSSPISWPEWG